MTQVNISQKRFSGGEISPDLESRTDLEVYEKSLSTSLNVLCTNKGDLIPRPGTEYVSLTSGVDSVEETANKKARLIPFSISDEESFMLELTEGRLRIFKDQKVLEGCTDVIGVPMLCAPVRSDDTAQYGNPLTSASSEFLFVRPSRFPLEAGAGPFYFDFDKNVYNGRQFGNVQTINQATINFSYADSSAIGKGSSTEFNVSHEQNSTDNRFWIHSVQRDVTAPSTERHSQFASQQCDIVKITDEYSNVGVDGAELEVVATSNFTDFSWVFEKTAITYNAGTSTISSSTDLDYFETSYLEEELFDIKYAFFGDYLYLAHKNHRPMTLVKTGPLSFRLQNFYFEGGPWRESSTYGECWQGGAKAAMPGDIHPNPAVAAEGRNFPFHANGEVQWDGHTETSGKNLNETSVITHIHLHENSDSISTSSSGFVADDDWIGRHVRIRFNTGEGSGRTNLTSGTYHTLDNDRKAVSGVTSADINNEESRFQGFSSFETSTHIWAEGVVEEERHIEPQNLGFFNPGTRIFTTDTPGRFLVGSNSFLAPGDIISNSELLGPEHAPVHKSDTEPYALGGRDWYVHSVYDDTQVYICDSFGKVGVDGQAFSGNYTATTSTVTVLKRRHTNPTRQLRIRIKKPFSFTSLQGSVNEVWMWLKPSSDNRIGYLFEDPLHDGTGGWPAAVSIFDNRLFFAANDENPSMIAASAKGDFTNFSPDDGGTNGVATVNDPEVDRYWGAANTTNPRSFPTDSFTYSLQEGLSGPILWLKSIPQGLVAGTTHGIYMSDKPKRNETYGPANWRMKLVSEEGSNKTSPVYVDGKIYYINSRGDKLLSLEYSVEADAFKPTVESLLSEHLLKNKIVELAFARSPIQVIWMLSADGTLVSAVMLESENQKSFFKHEIAGPSQYGKNSTKVNSIAVIPSIDDSFDQLWISSERNWTYPLWINNPTVQEQKGNLNTIEVLTQYSPYLLDSKDFVGLDLSITPSTERRRLGSSKDNIENFTQGAWTDLTDQMLFRTKTDHGITSGDTFLLSGFTGDYQYLNYGSVHSALAGTTGTTVKADAVLNPDLNKNAATETISRSVGGNTVYTGTGIFRNRFSSINKIGNVAMGTNPSVSNIGAQFGISYNGAFFERGIKYAESKSNSSDYEDGVLPVSTHIEYFTGVSTIFNDTPTFASHHGYSFVYGFKPEIYFTTLPPVLNNQLGDMDLNYLFLTSVSIYIKDSHQISVGEYGGNHLDAIGIVDDILPITSLSQDAVRTEGRYQIHLDSKEEETRTKYTFYPEAGYPFLLQSISFRGERSTRP